MNGKNNAQLRIKTAVGVLAWVSIHPPGKAKYEAENEDDREYTADIILEGTNAKALIDTLLGMVLENGKPRKGMKLASMPYRIIEDEEKFTGPRLTDNWEYQEGKKYSFHFKTNTTFVVDGEQHKKAIKLWDGFAKEKSLDDTDPIGNGSTGRIKGLARVYERARETGVSLYLNELQCIEHKPYSDDPFEAELDEAGSSEPVEQDDKNVMF